MKKDNELFRANDIVILDYSIELGDAKVVEMIYDKAYNYALRIAKIIGYEGDAADFGVKFFLYGNIIPIIFNVHANKKIDLKTLILTMDLFEQEVEKWKKNQ